jgi:DNA uptake protein ComE-like DNA-binding protein
MFITTMLAGLVLVLCRSMRVEAIASANEAAAIQASSIARGAEQYVIGLLAYEKDAVRELPENYFAAVPVGDGFFWIARPDFNDPALPLFGLTDESSKVNINTAPAPALLRLPYMTEELAAAVVDWRDTDSTPGQNGAENEYYAAAQPEPYACKNGDYETLEELLLVRGVTRQMLWGDGTAPPLGTSSSTGTVLGSGTSVINDIWLARGIGDLLTIYSSEPAPTANTDTGSGSGSGSGQQQQIVNVNARNQRPQLERLLTNLFDGTRAREIMNAVGTQNTQGDIFAFYFRAKLKPEELDQIIDSITATDPDQQPQQPQAARGKINVNTAPREVLATISNNLQPEDIQKVLDARQNGSSSGGGINMSNAATSTGIGWFAEALGDQKAPGLANLVTGKSYQWSADIIAVSAYGRAYKHIRIVVDTTGTTPQIIYRRDLTDRGWPMDPQILAALRQGQGAGYFASASIGGRMRNSTLGLAAPRGAMPLTTLASGGSLR